MSQVDIDTSTTEDRFDMGVLVVLEPEFGEGLQDLSVCSGVLDRLVCH